MMVGHITGVWKRKNILLVTTRFVSRIADLFVLGGNIMFCNVRQPVLAWSIHAEFFARSEVY